MATRAFFRQADTFWIWNGQDWNEVLGMPFCGRKVTMKNAIPLLGLAQVNISADDVSAARDWYTEVLGVEPYFQRPDASAPAYVEFRLGSSQDELGIVDSKSLPSGSGDPAGAIARWQVDDIYAAVDRLIELGAKEYEPVTQREADFITASVVDPFGNVLGLIHSPHYEEMSSASGAKG